MIATTAELYLSLPPGRSEMGMVTGFTVEAGALSKVQQAGWMRLLTDLVHQLEMESCLIEHTRTGFASALREQPLRQVEVARFLDRLQDERLGSLFQLQQYLQVNFGTAPLREVTGQRFHVESMTVGTLLERSSALSAQLLVKAEQTGVYFFEALAEAAEKGGRSQLARLALRMRFLAENRLDALRAIQAELGEPRWMEKQGGRVLLSLWCRRATQGVMESLELGTTTVGEAIGFDVNWFRGCLRYVQDSAGKGAELPRESVLRARAA